MTKNMGNADRVIRGIVALILLWLAFGTATFGSGILFWLALLVAVVFGVTAIVGTCPLYRVIGMNTCGT